VQIEHGGTVVHIDPWTAGDLSSAKPADLILVLDRGRVVERGTHGRLLAAGGLYRQLYETQFRPEAETLPGRSV